MPVSEDRDSEKLPFWSPIKAPVAQVREKAGDLGARPNEYSVGALKHLGSQAKEGHEGQTVS